MKRKISPKGRMRSTMIEKPTNLRKKKMGTDKRITEVMAKGNLKLCGKFLKGPFKSRQIDGT